MRQRFLFSNPRFFFLLSQVNAVGCLVSIGCPAAIVFRKECGFSRRHSSFPVVLKSKSQAWRTIQCSPMRRLPTFVAGFSLLVILSGSKASWVFLISVASSEPEATASLRPNVCARPSSPRRPMFGSTWARPQLLCGKKSAAGAKMIVAISDFHSKPPALVPHRGTLSRTSPKLVCLGNQPYSRAHEKGTKMLAFMAMVVFLTPLMRTQTCTQPRKTLNPKVLAHSIA